VTKLRVLDLFAGQGGFSLGLERTGGFQTAAFCEIEPYAQKVLARHWPGVPIYDDITEAEFAEPVDVVTAGFPCQDVSIANQNAAGLAGERSGLFWHIIRTVCMVGRPKLLLENVAALLNRGMGAVLGSLAQIGYDAEWHCIPASYVGARQLRDRIWIVAYPQRIGVQGWSPVTAAWCAQPREEQLAGLVQPCAWPTVSGARDRGTGHGVPDGIHRNKSLGNAVVPQIPELIGRAILASRAAS
jgi:DNA (cytosine-5)-methyltransferase 1